MKRIVVLLILICFSITACTAAPVAPADRLGNPKLVRIPQQGVLGGVCAGVAYYFGWNPRYLRVAWAGAVILLGTGVLVYVVLWFVIPPADRTPTDYHERTGT